MPQLHAERQAARQLRGPVERRIFGLPVTAAIVIGGVIVALAVAGFAVRRGRRLGRGRGNAYGRRDARS